MNTELNEMNIDKLITISKTKNKRKGIKRK
jgi:hypothetical protein